MFTKNLVVSFNSAKILKIFEITKFYLLITVNIFIFFLTISSITDDMFLDISIALSLLDIFDDITFLFFFIVLVFLLPYYI